MAKSATLTVKIVSDAKDAAKGFSDAESRVDKFRGGLDKAATAAGGLLLGMGAVAKQAFDAASAVQQSTGAIESVFGDQAKAVQSLAKKAATANGLSRNSYQETAAVLGAQLKNMGVAHDKLVPKVDELIDLGSDLAATFGGSTADAVAALSSLLRGERDPIERYGVAIKAADIEARLAAQGMGKLEGEAKKAAETQATFALLMEQTAAATGAHNRELDTAAGATAVAAASWEDAKAALGESLLPVVTDLATKLKDATDWLVANKSTVETWTPIIAGAAVAVIALSAAVKIATAAQMLFNLAMVANPIGAIIVAIITVIAVLGYLYIKFQGFRNFVNEALQFAFAPFIAIGKVIYTLIQDVAKAGSAFDVFKAVAKAALNLVLAPLNSIWDRIKQVGGWLSKAGSWAGKLFGTPMAVQVTHGADTAAAGLYGAAEGTGPWAPIRGAAMSPVTGGTSPSAGGGAAPIVNITVNGALDPQAVADQIAGLLRRRGITRGLTATVAL